MVSHRGCGGASSGRLRRDTRSDQGRDHQWRREHLEPRGRGRLAPPSRRAGGGDSRAAAREVGRGPIRIRRLEARRFGDGRRTDRVHARPSRALQGAAWGDVRAGAAEDSDGEDPEVRAPEGRGGGRQAVSRADQLLPTQWGRWQRGRRRGAAPSPGFAGDFPAERGRLLVPTRGEVAPQAPEGTSSERPASPPHSWGGGAAGAGGALSPGFAGYFPAERGRPLTRCRIGPIPRLRRGLPRKAGKTASPPHAVGRWRRSRRRGISSEGPHPPASPGTSPQSGEDYSP